KVNAIEGRNSARDVKMEDLAKFQVGNVFSEGVLQREILVKDQTNNAVEAVSAKNQSRVQIGNVYGSKGIWGD
ncbi:haddock calculated model of congo Red bound To the Het-S amyloid, partial [Dactylonectria estremocensis]